MLLLLLSLILPLVFVSTLKMLNYMQISAHTRVRAQTFTTHVYSHHTIRTHSFLSLLLACFLAFSHARIIIIIDAARHG